MRTQVEIVSPICEYLNENGSEAWEAAGCAHPVTLNAQISFGSKETIFSL